MGRTQDYKAAFGNVLGAYPELYGTYEQNARNRYKRIQESVLYFNHAIVNPPIDRHKPVNEVKDVYIQLVKETDAGIIVSGGEVVATNSALTHYNFIGFGSAYVMGTDPDFSLMFVAPIDAPGVKLISRASYEFVAGVTGSPFDYPLSSRFDENDARATGRVSMGVKGMNLADGDSVIGMQVAEENGELLFVSEMGMGKKTAMSEFKDQNRGGKGIRCYRVNAKTGNLAGVKVYKEGYELMLITTEGTVIRMKTDTIPVLGRDTSGVKLMQVDQENVKVSSIELIEESKEEEFAETSEETVGSKEV